MEHPHAPTELKVTPCFLCEELRYSFVLNTPQCAPEKLHGDALASPCPWSQGAKHRHHPEALAQCITTCSAQLYLPNASDTRMTTTPPSAKGLPVGGLATAVPTWRLCSQRLVNGASEQLLNLLDLKAILHCSRTSHAVMTNRRGCYRTTEGKSLLQRDPRWTPKEAGAAARNCHWAGPALDLDRNEPSAGDLAIKHSQKVHHVTLGPCTPSSWDCR